VAVEGVRGDAEAPGHPGQRHAVDTFGVAQLDRRLDDLPERERWLMVVIGVLDGFRAASTAPESPYRTSRKVIPSQLGRDTGLTASHSTPSAASAPSRDVGSRHPAVPPTGRMRQLTRRAPRPEEVPQHVNEDLERTHLPPSDLAHLPPAQRATSLLGVATSRSRTQSHSHACPLPQDGTATDRHKTRTCC
jgi:hypothetical protein